MTLRKSFNSIFTVLLLMFPIIRIYASGIPSLNLAELLMLILLSFSLVFLINQRLDFNQKEYYLLIIIFTFIFLSAISALCIINFAIGDSLLRIVKWLFYFLILLSAKYFLNKDLAVRLVKAITIIICTFLWIQLIAYYGFGINLTFRIPGLELNTTQVDLIVTSFGNSNIYRPYSLFLEPSHFAYYASIGLCVFLFLNKHKNYSMPLFISISLVASTSTAALVFLVVIWLYYSYYKLSRPSENGKIKYLTFILLFGLIFLYFLKDSVVVEYGLSKLSEGTARTDSASTYLSYLNGFTQIFGVGIGNEINYFFDNFGIEFKFIHGFGYVLVQSGYVGFFVYVLMLFLIYFKTTKQLRIFVFLFFLTNTFELCLRDIYLVVFLIWPFYFVSYINEENYSKV
ncbi:hypothetical protein CYL18_06140 [Pradoshia eiseniae]|uniref:Polysaccharide polymerase n=1 Tax=Pradoshia eiseniae TaxID=2064768 RepID=A0A2S7N2G0_9BACI|nr:hypothetical protein [Pradoshia eiseniae]PQD96178.1 hypothetical protein CYL18_06140 [Pradoshia eiseniae]